MCFALGWRESDLTTSALMRLRAGARELYRLRDLDLEAVKAAGESWQELGWDRSLYPEDFAPHWPALAAQYRQRVGVERRRQEGFCPECEAGGGLHSADCSHAREARM